MLRTVLPLVVVLKVVVGGRRVVAFLDAEFALHLPLIFAWAKVTFDVLEDHWLAIHGHVVLSRLAVPLAAGANRGTSSSLLVHMAAALTGRLDESDGVKNLSVFTY